MTCRNLPCAHRSCADDMKAGSVLGLWGPPIGVVAGWSCIATGLMTSQPAVCAGSYAWGRQVIEPAVYFLYTMLDRMIFTVTPIHNHLRRQLAFWRHRLWRTSMNRNGANTLSRACGMSSTCMLSILHVQTLWKSLFCSKQKAHCLSHLSRLLRYIRVNQGGSCSCLIYRQAKREVRMLK